MKDESAQQALNRAIGPIIEEIRATWCPLCGIPSSFHPGPFDVGSKAQACAVAEVRYEAQDHAS